MKRAHVFVSGRVQGVFFRYTTKQQADKLGLTGWVQNLNDGRVEFICEGQDKEVDRMIEWSRTGPPGAIVDNIDINVEEVTGQLVGFQIRY